ncbi:MAG: hypothetical protein JST73_05175 [Actinobacteria bacterium]|nr:hypothetical protein [Actinomycetota bacterium]
MTSPDVPTEPDQRAITDDEQGGDAACWANLVCDRCGRIVDAEHDRRCPGLDDDQ